ncbi:MAG: hypothetical protein KC561_09550 [Myxococcales bacterium]|nr:hypothetical protein [Myxococcales bacterium]
MTRLIALLLVLSPILMSCDFSTPQRNMYDPRIRVEQLNDELFQVVVENSNRLRINVGVTVRIYRWDGVAPNPRREYIEVAPQNVGYLSVPTGGCGEPPAELIERLQAEGSGQPVEPVCDLRVTAILREVNYLSHE